MTVPVAAFLAVSADFAWTRASSVSGRPLTRGAGFVAALAAVFDRSTVAAPGFGQAVAGGFLRACGGPS